MPRKTEAPEAAPARPLQLRDPLQLVPYERNARTHSDEQVAQIAASIQEFGFTNPLLVDEESRVIAGHGRLLAAKRLGLAEVPTILVAGLSDAQRRALILADNQLAANGGWDEGLLAAELGELAGEGFDLGVIGFDPTWLDGLLNPEPEGGENPSGPRTLGALAGEFLVAPFTVLNAREGWWQERKRQWLGLGIRSEVGRGDNLIGRSLFERISFVAGNHYQQTRDFVDAKRAEGLDDEAILEAAVQKWGQREAKGGDAIPGGAGPNAAYRKGGAAVPGGGGTNRRGPGADMNPYAEAGEEQAQAGGTSIFDPVLCELAYRWFCPPKGLVLDPFAGGSVRGIVAAKLGRNYVGIDLRPEQVAANRGQAAEILGEADGEARWIEGDAALALPELDAETADFVLSCPPYGDLEQYSDDPADLSTMELAAFQEAYSRIIAQAVARLKPDRFACFVVGDYRSGGAGFYRDFVSSTIAAFRDAGAGLYNEAILVTAVGSLPIRAGRTFRAMRKLGKTHQNVLVFCKGDPRKASAACGAVDVGAALEPWAEAEERGDAMAGLEIAGAGGFGGEI